MNPKVDWYFEKEQIWQTEIRYLRSLVLDCELMEELKWGCPCYTHQKTNIVLIHVFKEYCALLFFKGALLPDPHGILIQQTENVQAARQIRFTGLPEIVAQEAIVKSYIFEAIAVEKAGLKVQFKPPTALVFPVEFQAKLDGDEALKKAFEALSPGRQRAYNLYFTGAKQAKTREARVEKCIPMILQGKGLED